MINTLSPRPIVPTPGTKARDATKRTGLSTVPGSNGGIRLYFMRPRGGQGGLTEYGEVVARHGKLGEHIVWGKRRKSLLAR